jgi:DNA-binding MarR family transcriptional regulator
MSTLADDVWAAMTSLVMDSRGDWRRDVMTVTGLPFSRVRVLRRLAGGPLTMKELAVACMTDAPAATVAVNDLEDRGLAERRVDPGNGRVKIVSLTDAGRAMLARVATVRDVAPPGIHALAPDDLRTLRDLLARVTGTDGGTAAWAEVPADDVVARRH